MQKTVFILFVFGILISITEELLAVYKYKVVDGDSLEQGNVRIRLVDIDAPELFQECYDENNKQYKCGQKAFEELEKLMVDVESCSETGVDRYKRKLMECFDKNQNSINRKMVISGWAVSYGDKFKNEENEAKMQKSGIWKGRFMRPELYRALYKN